MRVRTKVEHRAGELALEDETRLSIDAIVESYLDARKNRESLTIADLLQRRGAHDRQCLETVRPRDSMF